MSILLQSCCVCITSNDGLINISVTDVNHVQWSSKLNKCVPAVNWDYDYFMCPKCIEQLEIAYNFYNLCLQSHEVRKQQAFMVKMKADELPDFMSVIQHKTPNTFNEENFVSPKIYVNETLDDREFVGVKSEELSTNEDEHDLCINISSSDEEFSSSEETSARMVKSATLDSLPIKSRRVYEKTYAELYDWLEKNTVNNKSITENLLLAYFSELSEIQKSSSLLAKYSMLKSTLLIKENIDIKKFDKLLSFLKRKSRGYKAKKSKGFTRQHIIKFLRDAPDEIYLMKKVFLIIGVAGGCRREELAYLETDNVQDMGSVLLINLKDHVTKIQRSFTVINNQESYFPDMLDIYRKYISLRPAHTSHKRLFIQYLRGKCTPQVVGKNTIGKIPSQIAKYLNLPDASGYTSHSLRRTSPTLLAPMTF